MKYARNFFSTRAEYAMVDTWGMIDAEKAKLACDMSKEELIDLVDNLERVIDSMEAENKTMREFVDKFLNAYIKKTGGEE